MTIFRRSQTRVGWDYLGVAPVKSSGYKSLLPEAIRRSRGVGVVYETPICPLIDRVLKGQWHLAEFLYTVIGQ